LRGETPDHVLKEIIDRVPVPTPIG